MKTFHDKYTSAELQQMHDAGTYEAKKAEFEALSPLEQYYAGPSVGQVAEILQAANQIDHVAFFEDGVFVTCRTFGDTDSDSLIWRTYDESHKRTNITSFKRERFTGECPAYCLANQSGRLVGSVPGGKIMSDYKAMNKQKQQTFDLMNELRREIDFAIGRVGNMNEMPDVSESDYLAILTALQVSRRIHRDYRKQQEQGAEVDSAYEGE